MTPEQKLLRELFHKAWGDATESPRYDKEPWRVMTAVIDRMTAPGSPFAELLVNTSLTTALTRDP